MSGKKKKKKESKKKEAKGDEKEEARKEKRKKRKDLSSSGPQPNPGRAVDAKVTVQPPVTEINEEEVSFLLNSLELKNPDSPARRHDRQRDPGPKCQNPS